MPKLGFPGLQGRTGGRGRGAPHHCFAVTGGKRHRRAVKSQAYAAFELENHLSRKLSC